MERQDLPLSKTRPGKRKVHSLIDKVYSRTNLALAWEKVKQNHGSAGVDAVTITEFEANKAFYLERLHCQLRDGTYQPQPVKRVEIDKSDGGVRKLGIPAIFDRVCQQALVQRREPLFEPLFEDCSFGYRKGRSPHDAMRRVWQDLNADYGWCVDADLRTFFDTIPQPRLVDMIAEEISEGRVLQLIWAMLRAGAMQGTYWEPTLTGVPQGAVASPMWSNIFLTPFDRAMTAAGFRLTRWADDFVVLCKTRGEAQRALAFAERFLREELGVTLHPQKTRIVHVSHGFEFLGYKVKQGKGYRLAASKRRSRTNASQPVCRTTREERDALQGPNPPSHPAQGSGEIARDDPASESSDSRLGHVLPQGARAPPLSSAGRMDRAPPLLVSRQTLAESYVAALSNRAVH